MYYTRLIRIVLLDLSLGDFEKKEKYPASRVSRRTPFVIYSGFLGKSKKYSAAITALFD